MKLHLNRVQAVRARVGGLCALLALFVVILCPREALALTSNEAILARELWQHGFGYIQIAAILGNAAGESGCDPTVDYDLSGQFNWPYEWGCGLFGYTDCGYSPTQLVLMQRTQLKSWAAEHGWDWASTEAQVEFTFGDSGGISWRDDWMTGLAENGYYWGYSGVPENMAYDATPEEFITETRLDVATYSWMACYGRGAAEPNHFASGLNQDDSGRMGEAQRVFDEISTGAYDVYFGEGGNGIPAARPEEVEQVQEAQQVEVEYIPVDEPTTISINDPKMPVVRYIPKSDPTYEMPDTPANTVPPEPETPRKERVQPGSGPFVIGALAILAIGVVTFVVARKKLEAGDEVVDWLEWSVAGSYYEDFRAWLEKRKQKAKEPNEPASKLESESEPTPEPDVEPTPEPDVEPTPEPAPEPEAEPEPETESGPDTVSKPEPESEPDTGSKAEPPATPDAT